MKKMTRRKVLALGSGVAMAAGSAMPAFARWTRKVQAHAAGADYVIVGAGSAGCVLANRLSAAGASVLMLEAGGLDTLSAIHDPLAWPGLQGSIVDWQYQTIPQSHTLGRVHAWARGKVLGGSSSINAMAHHRGHPSGYDNWASYGVRGWSFKELLPYFKRLETFAGGASEYHGSEGPLYIDVPHGNLQHPTARQFIAASIATGFAPTDDINGAQMEGPTWNHVALKAHQRQSTAVCYLRPALGSRNPPTVITGAQVSALVFDGERCVGVQYLHGGRSATVHAGREVLLTAGSIESPKLLMLSGIGAPAELAKFGIAVRAALPGVGKNLQDHLLGAGAVYEASQPLPVSRYQHGEAMQYLRTDTALAAPDMLLMFVTVPFVSVTLPLPPANAYTILPCIMQPQSRGTISLRSSNAADAPVINPNYFDAPIDAATMARGFEIAREIGANAALTDWRAREIYPADRWRDRGSRTEFVQQAANTFFHPVGTCAMGDREHAVVDSALRVRGLEGLRVIDASVIPQIPTAPTNAAVIGIAERAADLLLGRPQSA